MKQVYKIAVVKGDGIGPEVTDAAIAVLSAVLGPRGPLEFTEHLAGAELFLKTGDSFPDATLEACREADAVLHGAAGLPGVVHPDGTEAGLDFTLQLRSKLDLFANVRPIKLWPGVRGPLRDREAGDIDYVIVRENSEGLYAARGSGTVVHGEFAMDPLVQTRKGIDRIVRFAFDLARTRSGAPTDGRRRVTCCDKANVLRSYAFFREVFDAVAKDYPDIEAEHVLIDAMALHLVRDPTHYDVIVTENMFGDILSDLGAATVGGMGMAPSAELGASRGFFQASHGSAPDIAGKGIANPYGTVLAATSMLRWLGHRHDDGRLLDAASQIEAAVGHVLADARGRSGDIGGKTGSAEITAMLCDYLGSKGLAA